MASKTDTFTENSLLKAAWQRQQSYSKNASRYQRRFISLRTLLAALSITVVILAVLESQKLPSPWEVLVAETLLVLPITITALVAFSVRFDRGQNWILLRGSAEALKTEIYYYRTHVKPYDKADRGVILSERIQQLSGGLKGSPVHHGAMEPYENEVLTGKKTASATGVIPWLINSITKGISTLSQKLWELLFGYDKASKFENNRDADLTNPDQYVHFRLDTQFEWYRQQAKQLAKQLQIVQTSIYVFGGIGTLLAAYEPSRSWVAITTALVGGFTNYLEVKRIETSLVGYNQAADALYDIRAWWYSLPEIERVSSGKKFQRLVKSCEGTIRSETTSWLQDMQDRLAQLYGAGEDDNDNDIINGASVPEADHSKNTHETESVPG